MSHTCKRIKHLLVCLISLSGVNDCIAPMSLQLVEVLILSSELLARDTAALAPVLLFTIFCGEFRPLIIERTLS